MLALETKSSSGGAGIRGDGKVSTIRQLSWMFANVTSNLLDSALTKVSETYREPVFNPLVVEAASGFARHASPTRLGCDLFWASVPWDEVSKVIGQPRVIDFGCGTASYGDYWNMLLPQGVGEYVGIDISSSTSWSETKPFPRRFLTGGHVSGARVDGDLYFSQSALEHFKDDLSFFRDLQRKIAAQKTPSLQIHVVPSIHQVMNTGAHGWRAYSRKTLNTLTQYAPAPAKVYVVGLGGMNTINLYRRNITVPRLRKRLGLKVTPPNSLPSNLSAALEDNLAKDEPGVKPRFHSFAVVVDKGFDLNFGFRKIAS